MDISIVIPTHDRPGPLMELLASIGKQAVKNLNVEIIVVSNLRDDCLKEKLKFMEIAFPFRIHFLESGGLGVNKARNAGLKKATAQRILFLDDDVVLDDVHYLKKLFQYALAFPNVAAIGGPYKLSSKAGLIDKAYFALYEQWGKSGVLDNDETKTLVGGNTLYNRDVLKEELRFCKDIIFGGAEHELNARILACGQKMLLFKDLGVLHITRLSLKAFIKKAILQGRGSIYSTSPEERENGLSRPFLGAVSFYILLYDFFFKVGQVNDDLIIQNKIEKIKLLIRSLKHLNHLFYRRIIHKYYWIPLNFIKWHLLPLCFRLLISSLLLFFPFNTIGLYRVYIDYSDRLEHFILGLVLPSLREKKRLRKMMLFHSNVNWKDALGESQIKSKQWLIENIDSYIEDKTNIILIGGWVGLIAYLLNQKKKAFNSCLNIDKDPQAASASLHLNNDLVLKEKFSIHIQDALDFDYRNQNNSALIINTSTEHMDNFEAWIEKIPAGTRLVLQSNNMFNIPDHVNCKQNLKEFVADCRLSTVSYADELDLGNGWARYMVIGIR